MHDLDHPDQADHVTGRNKIGDQNDDGKFHVLFLLTFWASVHFPVAQQPVPDLASAMTAFVALVNIQSLRA
jgi:hypothetical protein